jgi:hypothetical protein
MHGIYMTGDRHMQTAEALADIEAIKQLKARYFRCMDTKDWSEFREVFTQDAVFDVRGALEPPRPDASYDEPPIVGADAIVSYVREGLRQLVSVHHGHMPEIEILPGGEARGLWAMEDILIAPEGAPFRVFRGYGHYRETYRKSSGGWRIATLRLTRLLIQKD